MGVKVEGLKELQQELEKVVKEMEDDLQIGTDDAANAVAGMLRSNVPVGPTGNLKASIGTKPLPRRANYPQVTMVGCDYKVAPHQHLVEFGSSRNSPNPFFRRTIDGARGAIMSAIKSKASKPLQGRGG